MIIGLAVSLYELMTTQKPLILPFVTGFRTGVAAISQDTGRILQGFLFGSGFGTYTNDFLPASGSRQYTILMPICGRLLFFRSSSFVLEMVTTTGFLGLLSISFYCLPGIKRAFSLPADYPGAHCRLCPADVPTPLSRLPLLSLPLLLSFARNAHPSRYEDLEFYFSNIKAWLDTRPT